MQTSQFYDHKAETNKFQDRYMRVALNPLIFSYVRLQLHCRHGIISVVIKEYTIHSFFLYLFVDYTLCLFFSPRNMQATSWAGY